MDRLYLSKVIHKPSSSVWDVLENRDGSSDGIHKDLSRLMSEGKSNRLRQERMRGVCKVPFLWRAENGYYYVLSEKPREDNGLLDVESKPFAPKLVRGDRIEFVLRLSAVVERDGKKHDIVMDKMYLVPKCDRASVRMEKAHEAADEWFRCREEGFGIQVESLLVNDYRTERVRKGTAVSVLDLTGRLTVTDPDSFLSRVRSGFGRRKAFGCGLMLLGRCR